MNSQNMKTVVCTLFATVLAQAAFCAPDDCTLPFTGSYRATIKRRAANLPYPKYNNGNPIDLNQWFTLTEQLETHLGTKGSSVPKTQIIKGVEDIQIAVKAYLLAVRFEKNVKKGDGKDNEFHIEIGATPNWQEAHAVVEVTTGTPSCSARKNAWKMAVADSTAAHAKTPTTLRVFAKPPQVLITGYVFVDGIHAHGVMTAQKWAHDSGGRGIQYNKLPSQVNGLFEIHPVISLTPIAN